MELKKRRESKEDKRKIIEQLFVLWDTASNQNLGQLLDKAIPSHNLADLDNEDLIKAISKYIQFNK